MSLHVVTFCDKLLVIFISGTIYLREIKKALKISDNTVLITLCVNLSRSGTCRRRPSIPDTRSMTEKPPWRTWPPATASMGTTWTVMLAHRAVDSWPQTQVGGVYWLQEDILSRVLMV